MRRFVLAVAAPTLLLLGLAVLPLATGARTLYLRDVLHSHYPLRATATEALRRGEVPLVDPHRSGGQPLAGNLNALPFYPTSLFGLLATSLWTLNAHFWIHLLLAPLAGFWLGRAWGLSRAAAWATGTLYATSGYFLSLLNLYNLIAGAALAPAWVAAALDASRPPDPGACRRRRLAAVAAGLLWTLLLLAGDPLYAGLAALLATSAVLARGRPAGVRPLVLAVILGTLVAAPQLVELARILPLSFRGHAQYSEQAALAQSWDPRSALEWVLPLAFGDPDPASFWGRRFYGGNEPLLFSLAPGVLALALVVAAGRPRSRATNPGGIWGWGWILGGAFVALGYYNPVVRLAAALPGAGALRYPVKVWLVVALAASLLGGLGWERLRGGGRRAVGRVLAAAAFVYGGGALLLVFGPADLLAPLDPRRLSVAAADAERLRWASTAVVALAFVALLAASLALSRRRPGAGGGLLLAVHVAGQLVLLAPLYDSDAAAPYRAPPPLLAAVPADRPVVHGAFHGVFGGVYERLPVFPDRRTFWLTRAHFAELHPFSGIAWGRRYGLAASPEGLDSFLSVALVRLFPRLDDLDRLRLLEATGVGTLLLPRDLTPEAAPRAALRTESVGELGTLRVYELIHAAPPVALVGEARRAPHLEAAIALLTDPGFDPRTAVVLPGDGGGGSRRPAGTATVLDEGWERVEVEVASAAGGWLVLQRAFQPFYRATVDGAPARLEVANLQQTALEVGAGRHRVVVAADRRPTRIAAVVAAGAFVALLALAGRRGPR